MEKQAPLRTFAFSAEAARQLLQLRRPALALEMADRLLAQNPTNTHALLVRSDALRQLERLPEAIVAAQEAVAQAPQSGVAFHQLARALGQNGKLWEAELAVREAIRLDPTNASYYGFLAQLAYLLVRPDEAIANASAGLACNARHADCLLWRAVAYERCSQPAAADADFRLALRLAPASSLLHRHRGTTLLKRAEPMQAAQHLAEALRLDPTESATVIPLLRQACREQHWPGWMVRRRQQLRHEWQHQYTLTTRGGNTALLLPYFSLVSWWKTRHDAAFQERLPGTSLRARGWNILAVALPFGLALLLLILVVPAIRYTIGSLNQTSLLEGWGIGLVAALAPLYQAIKQRKGKPLHPNP